METVHAEDQATIISVVKNWCWKASGPEADGRVRPGYILFSCHGGREQVKLMLKPS